MRFRDLPVLARAYVVLVCASSLVLIGLSIPSAAAAPLELAALLTAAAILAHSFPVSTPGKQAYHVSLPFFVAAIVLLGPLQLAACIAAVHIAEHWRRRRSGFAQIFNAAAYTVAALAAQAVFRSLAGGALDL